MVCKETAGVPQLPASQSGVCLAASKRKPKLHGVTTLDLIVFTHKKAEGGDCWFGPAVQGCLWDAHVVPIIISHLKAIKVSSHHDNLSYYLYFFADKDSFPQNFSQKASVSIPLLELRPMSSLTCRGKSRTCVLNFQSPSRRTMREGVWN